MNASNPTTAKQRVLFLCTGNSCRSQIGEALVNHLLGDRWEAYSAGTRPAGFVHPLAIAVMQELGLDLSRAVSKTPDVLRHVPFDRVITVCDNAAQDCPLWLGAGQVTHLPFPDPAAAVGTEAERLAVFRAVRDAMRDAILAALTTP